jgi:hypothetical protein
VTATWYRSVAEPSDLLTWSVTTTFTGTGQRKVIRSAAAGRAASSTTTGTRRAHILRLLAANGGVAQAPRARGRAHAPVRFSAGARQRGAAGVWAARVRPPQRVSASSPLAVSSFTFCSSVACASFDWARAVSLACTLFCKASRSATSWFRSVSSAARRACVERKVCSACACSLSRRWRSFQPRCAA